MIRFEVGIELSRVIIDAKSASWGGAVLTVNTQVDQSYDDAVVGTTISSNSCTTLTSGVAERFITLEVTTASSAPSEAIITVQSAVKSSPGEDGEGVPTGGTSLQILRKASGNDYDTEWSYEKLSPLIYTFTGGPLSSGVTRDINIEEDCVLSSATLTLNSADNFGVSFTRYQPSGGSLGSSAAVGSISLTSTAHTRTTDLSGYSITELSAGDVIRFTTTGSPEIASTATVSLGRYAV